MRVWATNMRSDGSVHANIYAIGATAAITARPVPSIAPAAKQTGQYVARTISRAIVGGGPGPSFYYKHHGGLANDRKKSSDRLAWAVPPQTVSRLAFLERRSQLFLIGSRNRAIVALDWLWEYASLRRGARLITVVGLPPEPQLSTNLSAEPLVTAHGSDLNLSKL